MGNGGPGRKESNWSVISGKYDTSAWYIDSGATAHMTSQRDIVDMVSDSKSAQWPTTGHSGQQHDSQY